MLTRYGRLLNFPYLKRAKPFAADCQMRRWGTEKIGRAKNREG
jgi:hypothetical protein